MVEEDTVRSDTERVRAELKEVGKSILALKKRHMTDPSLTNDKELDSEAIANTIIAFRHVEDAAMRLGKVLQALNGGVSQYDNSGVVEQK